MVFVRGAATDVLRIAAATFACMLPVLLVAPTYGCMTPRARTVEVLLAASAARVEITERA